MSNQDVILPDIFYLDDFEECLNQSESSIFCTITAKLLPKNSTNPSDEWKRIEELSSDQKKFRHDLLRHGICVPKICWNYHETISTCLDRIYHDKYKDLGLVSRITQQHCETRKSEYTVGTLETLTLKILTIYIIFVLFVSVWVKLRKFSSDAKNDQKISQFKKILSIFSAFDHINYILSDPSTNKTTNHLSYLEGTRFFLSFCTILFHVIFALWGTPVANPSQVEETLQSPFGRFIGTGGINVQFFFVISSFLLAVSFFKKLQKSKRISFGFIVRLILKRYLRLTLGYALIVLLHSTWIVHLNRGPFWDRANGEEYRICRQNWWENLLYINNFNFGTKTTCLLHTWYLSADFQFTILGLLILWMNQKKPKNILLVSGFLIIFQIVYMFYTLASNRFEIAYAFKPENCLYLEYFDEEELQATWTHVFSNVAGFAIGLAFGYLYVYHDGNIFTKKSHEIASYLAVAIIGFGPPFFAAYYMSTEYYSNSPWFAATYGSIHQVLYVTAAGVWVLGMSQGIGGAAKRFLESRPMHILGQLSFGAYLVHYTFLRIEGGSRKSLIHVSVSAFVIDLILHLTLSYLSSLILTAFFIIPFGILVTVLL